MNCFELLDIVHPPIVSCGIIKSMTYVDETSLTFWLSKLKNAHDVYIGLEEGDYDRANRLWLAIQYVLDELVVLGYDRDWIECLFLFGEEFMFYEKARLNKEAQKMFWGYSISKREEISKQQNQKYKKTNSTPL